MSEAVAEAGGSPKARPVVVLPAGTEALLGIREVAAAPGNYHRWRSNVDEVRFYRSSERPHGCFSNLYRRGMEFEGRWFATAEHAYQHGKARKPEVREWLMAAPSPSLLAMAAHGLYSWDVAPGWSKGRRDRMRAVVAAKFAQHADLAAVLLGTGDARIVESSTVDNEVNRRWGQIKRGDQWIGTNWLGLILVEVREGLRGGGDRAAAVEELPSPEGGG